MTFPLSGVVVGERPELALSQGQSLAHLIRQWKGETGNAGTLQSFLLIIFSYRTEHA